VLIEVIVVKKMNTIFIKLSNVNKLDDCHIPYTVPSASVPTQFNRMLWA